MFPAMFGLPTCLAASDRGQLCSSLAELTLNSLMFLPKKQADTCLSFLHITC